MPREEQQTEKRWMRYWTESKNIIRCFQVARSILNNQARDVDYDGREVVACLENDPALAVKILRTINSSRYGLRREVTNLRQAVALLGQRALRLVAMTFSLVDGLSRGAAGQLCQDYWRRSITMATLSSRLAKLKGKLDHNDAYSAGLLADLGVLILAQVKQDEYVDLVQSVSHGPELIRAEQEKYGFTHAELGAQLLTRWGFPESLMEAARLHHRDVEDDNPLHLTTHCLPNGRSTVDTRYGTLFRGRGACWKTVAEAVWMRLSIWPSAQKRMLNLMPV